MRGVRLAAAVAALLAALPAAAQDATPTAQTRAAYEAAFQETLKKPSDPLTVLRFADLAVQVGDLQGAISALERLLLYDSDQPNIKLELGVLYFRLGSDEMARKYLEAARMSTRATRRTRERAEQYLADLNDRSSRSQFAGDVLVGIGYSNNANSGPAGLVQTFGFNVVPNPTFTQQPDFNVTGAATIRHRYDLGRQDNGTMESVLQFYSTRQFQVTQANVLLLDLATGPRTSPFAPGFFENVTVRPFLTGRYVAVQDMVSYWAWGAGVEWGAPIGPQIQSTVNIFGRRRYYLNNPTVPTNDKSSGDEAAATAEFDVQLTPSMTLTLTGGYTRYVAVEYSQSYLELGCGASMEVRFTDPVAGSGRAWSVLASAAMAQAIYDKPDDTVSATTTRVQNDVILGLLLTVPLTDSISLVGLVNYTNRQASLSTYAYDALSALVGVGWRF